MGYRVAVVGATGNVTVRMQPGPGVTIGSVQAVASMPLH